MFNFELSMSPFFSALFLQAGYNTAIVTIGASLLSASAAAIGTFVLLRKRSLVSDAISHATLPGLCLAFMVMALLTGDGRSVIGLMVGSAITAGIGLLVVDWLTSRTRLSEDAAIGAVLSVFFGAGVVLMTVIQVMDTGRQAGLSGYLLGSTAGMLRSEAEIIAIAATATGLAIFAMRRPFTLVCFDPEFASVRGVHLRLTDLTMMGILLTVTVIGLKVAGLVLIVALTIIPPVTARLWTDRPSHMVLIASAFGGISAWIGAVISSLGRGFPTGAVIVLIAFALFVFSLLISPKRGLLAGYLRHRRFQGQLHERQGLLALKNSDAIYDADTLRRLSRRGWIRNDGAPTSNGLTAAVIAARDDARWSLYRKLYPQEADLVRDRFLEPMSQVVPHDQLHEIDRLLSDAKSSERFT